MSAGLDPGCVDFELCSPDVLCQLAAYGLAGRFAHWSHGRNYEQMRHRCDLSLVSHLEGNRCGPFCVPVTA